MATSIGRPGASGQMPRRCSRIAVAATLILWLHGIWPTVYCCKTHNLSRKRKLSISHKKIPLASGLSPSDLTGGTLTVHTSVHGSKIAPLTTYDTETANAMIDKAHEEFLACRDVPAPRRGEFVQLVGNELQCQKQALSALVMLECGKILQEGLGEVQEMIDICDFALGLSRQLYGLNIASERPGHTMGETWHPMGVSGVITVFNLPVAPWYWNAATTLVCSDSVIWKPLEKTPLTALAVQDICEKVRAEFGKDATESLTQVLVGERDLGQAPDSKHQVCPCLDHWIGPAVATDMAQRLGRSILEMGVKNAMIVAPSADLEMALPAIVFSAVGTAGQRCTWLRRLIVHEDIYEAFVPHLVKKYEGLPIGDPLAEEILVGPLIDFQASTVNYSGKLPLAQGIEFEI